MSKQTHPGLVSKRITCDHNDVIRLQKISNQSDQVAFDEEGYYNHVFEDFLITFKLLKL